MPKLARHINRFNFGEVSPLIWSRTDLGQYAAACQTLENFIPLLQGPVKRRGGTRFRAASGNGANPVLLHDFAFSQTTSYVLEFGHNYLRFFHRGQPLKNQDGSLYQIATPWGQADLFYNGLPRLKMVQSADVMWIVCASVPPQRLKRHGHLDWRVSPLPNWSPRPNPAAAALFRERLCFAALETVYISQAGAFENFKLNAAGQTADDPLEINVYGQQMNEIEWLCPAGRLLVGTRGGEFLVGEATTVEPFGPENVKVTPETAFGSSPLQALRVGAVVFFVQRAGRKLRQFVYDLNGDSYVATDLTAAAEHVTAGGLTDFVWISQPLETLWAARADGQLLGFTYSKEQEMNAWHRHILGGGGRVHSLAAVPAVQGGRDELWLAVRREVNGQVVHYIETLEPGHELGEPQEESFFVDSGLTVRGAGLTEISGLDHLEGHEVHILADGGVQPPQVVRKGRVGLQYPADVIQVGLPYRSLLTTVNFEADLPDGTAQGRPKRTTHLQLRLLESAAGAAGAAPVSAPEPSMGTSSAGYGSGPLALLEYWPGMRDMDKAPGLYSGLLTVPWPGGYEADGAVTVVHDQPLPFLLGSLVQCLLIEGKN